MGKIPNLEDCKPGFDPVEYNVIVYPEVLETKTAGGVFLPPSAKETQELAGQRGRLVAASPLAFNYDSWPDDARKPQAGDVVLFAKYAGALVKDDAGVEFRVIKDKDVIAVLRA